ncbi:MAG: bifunctional diaminohydroxyphosphoribosylaminopyrimidine deaminase/5-amino-6-(5-phosphoribosylamino)uracil reductase RibD [Microscillaceae bacterium]|nr:bifunctional diaminohydroxyphosphoribosylaminopyrimidine deaminase/5-amino-6-(5-phosphoribosylamino)uracil reductase RibD [Microscillaceae bacterium]
MKNSTMIDQNTEWDTLFMQRALDLATLGHGRVSPNPMVGCVIVDAQNQVIAEGWHQRYGQAHAEVNALNAVADPTILPQSTLYVNLEPCAHYGKTPPCAEAIIQHQLGRVVVANADPNPLVAGKGLLMLKEAGIKVQEGVLEEEGYQLNKRFFTFMEKKRPYVILKWAETADGFMARENFDSRWISNLLSRKIVHKWRSEEDAIMVGKNTARFDNPKLTVRDWSGRNPLRIVVDRHLELSPNLIIFNGETPTICYNSIKNEQKPNLDYVKIQGKDFLNSMMQDLYQRKVSSVIVEGGSFLLNLLYEQNIWDEAHVFKSGFSFKNGIKAPRPEGILVNCRKFLDNWYFEYLNQ